MSSEVRNPPGSVGVAIRRYDEHPHDDADLVAVEEPLEIQLLLPGAERPFSLSVTMRTPGHDEDLAAGFIFTEGIIDDPALIEGVALCAPNRSGHRNVVKVRLAEGTRIDRERLTRHVYTTSSCGVCGKTSIEAVRVPAIFRLESGSPPLDRSIIEGLPAALRKAQVGFDSTGGVHAAGLFDLEGRLVEIREDVGRHNAVDKIIGAAARRGEIPLGSSIMMVSGRAGFELVQKSVRAGIPVMAAVSAPSSLAIELAREHGMTLLAFVRDGRFNCYAGPERITS